MKSWSRRIAATAGAVGLAAWVAGVPNLPALAASHSDGMATNPYSPSYGHDYRKGAVPTRAQSAKMKSWDASHTTTGANTLQYNGGVDGIGVTSGTPKVYLVFWGSQWGTQGTDANGNITLTHDPDNAAPYLQQLFRGLGTGGETWSGTMTQYCDGNVSVGATSCPAGSSHVGYPGGALLGGALAGVWYDNSAAEPTSATGNQIGTEALAASAHFGNTTGASNRYVQYDIVSSTGLNPDNWLGQGFCAWHDYNGDSTLSGGAVHSSYDFSFTNMPYVADLGGSCGQNFVNSGTAGVDDGFSIVNGHEFAETITDQNPAGGWINFHNGEENGDECAWISSGTGAAADVAMGTGSFAMQSTWSNDTNNCAIAHTIVGGGGGGSSDFTISDNPTTGSVTAGSGPAAVTTVSTSPVGTAGTVNLTTSGVPSGVTANFGSSSVTAGNSTSLTFSASTSATAGTYPISITGTEGSAVHNTSYSLTVSPASGGGGGNVIVNGGFETGTFSGWTISGAANIITSPKHSGNDAAAAGYFSPYGTATIAQAFKAASGNSSLTLWYLTACTGSISSNYSTITLRDNTTSSTTTLLNRTCVNASAWQSLNVPITASHSYTLTVTNRDTRTQKNYLALDDVSTS